MSDRTPGTVHCKPDPTLHKASVYAGNGDEIVICDVCDEDVDGWEEMAANAAFIVRAWNCHDALVAALECQAALDAWDEDATAEESLGITLSKHGLRWPTHGRFEQIKAVKRFEAARFVKDLRDRTLKLTKDQS